MSLECVRSEGALIPADILAAIADGRATGQRPQDFGLSKTVRLTDEIAAAWSDARAFWTAFQHALRRLPGGDPATTQTRELWVQPLLGVLGYDALTYMRSAAVVEGQSYAISHRAGSTEDTPPVHIAGCGTDLDTRPASGRPRLSPHALIQEYLNRTEHLWGIVTNGYALRLLRNSVRTSRPTYAEFDLRQIMEGEKFAEFALFYRLLHRTRLPQGIDDGPKCLLEAYHQQAIEAGGRVRDGLRYGVEEALKILGGGFLAHPANEELRGAVSNGHLKPGEYYAQLLRLVYRLLFLMVSEERKLIGPTDPKRLDTHRRYYSVTRLRALAERRISGGERHEDLWLGLLTTFRLYSDDDLAARAGIAPLNGDLFGPGAIPALEKTHLTNQHLLHTIWHLSTYTENKIRRRVNYAALDVEELGSVYESLLDYHPQIEDNGGRPIFNLVLGSERKTTGSYYTPPELVQELIRHALDPVIEARLQEARTPKDQEIALRSLSVCDPACGSGHFLLAAARRIGRELARVRTGEDEPTPGEFRLAVREVIQHCIYGVDRNPLAVDLCKLALWLEGHWTGKPLTFLDHRIKCGDSLVGVLDPSVLEGGIPDEAFSAVAGDDKKVAAAIRKRNRQEREGQRPIAYPEPAQARSAKVAHGVLVYLDLPEETSADIRRKAELYRKNRERAEWWKSWTASNLWTSAFFSSLTNPNDPAIPIHDRFRDYLDRGKADGRLVGRASAMATQRRFFHWHLEFPEVFGNDGFDVVLGNPPFMGGLKISTDLGDHYLKFLCANYSPAGGTADLCAYFYRRAFSILRPGGGLGMVATNTVGQGDTRAAGLAPIVEDGGTITLAHRFIRWPGAANVEVNLLAIRKGPWKPQCLLDGNPVPFISSRLDDEAEEEPRGLAQNEAKAFIGSYVLGMGYVLQPEEAQRLIAKDPRNRECLFPYLTGDDLNSRPDQSPSRWVINFFDWAIEKAEMYPDLMRIVREKVKPERDKVKRDRNRERWWIYAENRPGLYRTIESLRRLIVRSRVGELHAIAFVPNGWVYSDRLVIFAFEDDYHFALLQCTLHEVWLRKYGFTLRTDMCYAPEDCFDTFPFPQVPASGDRDRAARIGPEYQEYRWQVMLDRNLGLTKTYNLFHDPECRDSDIQRLRDLHAEMDRAILACYRWQDLEPGHGFHQNERGLTRYTISPPARREILRRLLALNLQIAETEAQSGV